MKRNRKYMAILLTTAMLSMVTGCASTEEQSSTATTSTLESTTATSTEESNVAASTEESNTAESTLESTEECTLENSSIDTKTQSIQPGDVVYLGCEVREWPIEEWQDRGEVTFVVESGASQFKHPDYDMPKEEIEEKVEVAVGKGVGDYFTLGFEYGDCRALEQYTILEIKKNADMGNSLETIEYGDTIRASYKHTELMAEDGVKYNKWDVKGEFFFTVDESTTHFEGSEYPIPEEVVKNIIRELQNSAELQNNGELQNSSEQNSNGESQSSSELPSYGVGSWMSAEYTDREMNYNYNFCIMGVNDTNAPSYVLPENWNYQFGAPEIGNFYNDLEGGVVEADDGYMYGFEEGLGGGCSSWCGANFYYEIAEASSTLKPQGQVSYEVNNVTGALRDSVWAEGVEGDGVGETIEIRQAYLGSGEDVFQFNSICIVNGYAENETKWQENNRVKSLKLYFEDVYMGTITLEDTMKPQYIDITPVKMSVGNGREAKFCFEIAEVYEGTKYDDTCITGIAVEFEGRYAH